MTDTIVADGGRHADERSTDSDLLQWRRKEQEGLPTLRQLQEVLTESGSFEMLFLVSTCDT